MAKKKSMNDAVSRNNETTVSLFGDPMAALNFSELSDPEDKTLAETNGFDTRYISRDEVIDNQQNRFTVANTYFLEQSILRLGQVQPILVVHIFDENGLPTGKYEIKAGSRRFKAINSICEKAEKDGNTEIYEKFNKLYVTILPMGITDEEIDRVITETNTTTRQISIEDLFKNFDIVFEKDKDGSYKYLSANGNKYKETADMLKNLGYNYSVSTVKDLSLIYLCSNPKLRENFENGFLSKRQCLVVARMDDEERDKALEKFDTMTEEEVSSYIKEYNKTKKDKKKKTAKGIEVINTINNLKTNISTQRKKTIVFLDKVQKEKCIGDIASLMEELEEFVREIELIEIEN